MSIPYDLRNGPTFGDDLDVVNNFWNITNSNVIESIIFDGNDDLNITGTQVTIHGRQHPIQMHRGLIRTEMEYRIMSMVALMIALKANQESVVAELKK